MRHGEKEDRGVIKLMSELKCTGLVNFIGLDAGNKAWRQSEWDESCSDEMDREMEQMNVFPISSLRFVLCCFQQPLQLASMQVNATTAAPSCIASKSQCGVLRHTVAGKRAKRNNSFPVLLLQKKSKRNKSTTWLKWKQESSGSVLQQQAKVIQGKFKRLHFQQRPQ